MNNHSSRQAHASVFYTKNQGSHSEDQNFHPHNQGGSHPPDHKIMSTWKLRMGHYMELYLCRYNQCKDVKMNSSWAVNPRAGVLTREKGDDAQRHRRESRRGILARTGSGWSNGSSSQGTPGSSASDGQLGDRPGADSLRASRRNQSS